jgi:hypothetical protein
VAPFKKMTMEVLVVEHTKGSFSFSTNIDPVHNEEILNIFRNLLQLPVSAAIAA